MRNYLAFFFFLCSVCLSFGQRNYNFDRKFLSSADFRVAIPLGQFYNNLDAVAIGLGGYTMYGPWDAPVFLGVEGAWLTYAHEEVMDGDFDIRTNSRMITGHAVAQYVFAISPTVQPYFNGMIGFKNLYTNTRTIDDAATSNKVVNRRSNLNDWAFSYGGAFGFYIGLDEYFPFRIDLRLSYLGGSTAEYLSRNDELDIKSVDNPIEVFEEKSGPTHMLMPQVGIVLVL